MDVLSAFASSSSFSPYSTTPKGMMGVVERWRALLSHTSASALLCEKEGSP